MFRLWRDSYERVDIYSRRNPTMPPLLREGIHREGEESVLDESIVLVGWLIVYAIPVGILAYWLEKKLQDTGGKDE